MLKCIIRTSLSALGVTNTFFNPIDGSSKVLKFFLDKKSKLFGKCLRIFYALLDSLPKRCMHHPLGFRFLQAGNFFSMYSLNRSSMAKFPAVHVDQFISLALSTAYTIPAFESYSCCKFSYLYLQTSEIFESF